MRRIKYIFATAAIAFLLILMAEHSIRPTPTPTPTALQPAPATQPGTAAVVTSIDDCIEGPRGGHYRRSKKNGRKHYDCK